MSWFKKKPKRFYIFDYDNTYYLGLEASTEAPQIFRFLNKDGMIEHGRNTHYVFKPGEIFLYGTYNVFIECL